VAHISSIHRAAFFLALARSRHYEQMRERERRVEDRNQGFFLLTDKNLYEQMCHNLSAK
jgi:hypothetical protein